LYLLLSHSTYLEATRNTILKESIRIEAVGYPLDESDILCAVTSQWILVWSRIAAIMLASNLFHCGQ
jgi:hypothetical protein